MNNVDIYIILDTSRHLLPELLHMIAFISCLNSDERVLSSNIFHFSTYSNMIITSESKKAKTITYPTDVNFLDVFGKEELECFHCLL